MTALSRVLAALPDGFPATLMEVQHLDSRHRSLMADIRSRRTPLQVKQAEEGEDVGLEATHRCGKAFQCRIACSPLVGSERDTQVVILFMEEWSGHA